MEITIYGAACEVTGSCYLLDAGEQHLLIDCGLFQGSPKLERLNYLPRGINAPAAQPWCTREFSSHGMINVLQRTSITAMLVLITNLVGSPQPCTAHGGDYGFPGKGSAADWSDALPYYNRGNRYLNEKRYADAAEDYRTAISKYQFDPDFFINLGVALRKLEDYPGAEQAFKQALELNNKDWSAWNDLGNVYLKENRLEETLSCFEHALKCNPPTADASAVKGDIADIHKLLHNPGREPASKTGSAAVTTATQSSSKTKTSAHSKSSVKAEPAPSVVPNRPTQQMKDWGYQ